MNIAQMTDQDLLICERFGEYMNADETERDRKFSSTERVVLENLGRPDCEIEEDRRKLWNELNRARIDAERDEDAGKFWFIVEWCNCCFCNDFTYNQSVPSTASDQFDRSKTLANASHTKVINIEADIAQLRTLHDAAVEERNSALLTAVEERNSALYAAGRFDLGKDWD